MAKFRIGWDAGTVLGSSPTKYRIKWAQEFEVGDSEADRIIGGGLSSRVFDLSATQRAKVQAGALISPQAGGSHQIYDDNTVTLAKFIEEFFPPAFAEWRQQLLAHSADFPSETINKGLDFLYWGKYGAALILRNNTYTTARRFAYAQLVIRGALDTQTADQFLRKESSLTAPTAPISWVSLPTGTPAQLNLRSAIDVVGALPGSTLPHDYATWTAAITDTA